MNFRPVLVAGLFFIPKITLKSHLYQILSSLSVSYYILKGDLICTDMLIRILVSA